MLLSCGLLKESGLFDAISVTNRYYAFDAWFLPDLSAPVFQFITVSTAFVPPGSSSKSGAKPSSTRAMCFNCRNFDRSNYWLLRFQIVSYQWLRIIKVIWFSRCQQSWTGQTSRALLRTSGWFLLFFCCEAVSSQEWTNNDKHLKTTVWRQLAGARRASHCDCWVTWHWCWHCLDQELSCFFIDEVNEAREVSLYAPWPSRNCHTEAVLFLRVQSSPKNQFLQGDDANLWTMRSFHGKVDSPDSRFSTEHHTRLKLKTCNLRLLQLLLSFVILKSTFHVLDRLGTSCKLGHVSCHVYSQSLTDLPSEGMASSTLVNGRAV